MMHDYRAMARAALARAKLALAETDPEQVRFAALQLRMAMEALTYDRAQAFKNEIPPTEYSTWQPRRLMELLLSINPHADQNSSLRFGREEVVGEPAAEMHFLGSEKVLNLANLKRQYDAIGSVLHIPTFKQLDEGHGFNEAKLRQRCAAIATDLDDVLSSNIYNITLGSFAQIDCMNCGKPVRRRLPEGQSVVEANCFHCKVGYKILQQPENKVLWEPIQQEVSCPTPSCSHKFAIWDSEIEAGRWWKCPGCQVRFQIGYSFSRMDPPHESVAVNSQGG